MSSQNIIVKDIPVSTVAYLQCRGPWSQIPVMLARLDQLMAEKKLTAIGPYSGVYYNTPGEVAVDNLEWEVFRPISPEVSPYAEEELGFGVKRRSSARVAAIIYKGSYRKTAAAYADLDRWISENGFEICGPAEEEYMSGMVNGQVEQPIEIRLPVCP